MQTPLLMELPLLLVAELLQGPELLDMPVKRGIKEHSLNVPGL